MEGKALLYRRQAARLHWLRVGPLWALDQVVPALVDHAWDLLVLGGTTNSEVDLGEH